MTRKGVLGAASLAEPRNLLGYEPDLPLLIYLGLTVNHNGKPALCAIVAMFAR